MNARGRSRRQPLLLVCSAWLAAGCQGAGAPTNEAAASATASSAPAVAVGSEVVAARGELSFVQGTVAAIVGEQVTVRTTAQPDGGTSTSLSVTSDRVWPLGSLSSAPVGGAAICRLDRHPTSTPTWLACRIDTIAGGVRVRDPRGAIHTIDRARVVVPDEATTAALARYLDREARHQAFDEAFEAAGAPHRPAGWVPSAGDRVVARFVDTSWYGAEVLQVEPAKGKVRVRWDGGTWDEQDVPVADVAPRPQARAAERPAELRAGQLAMAPPDEVSGRWKPLRVVAVSGESVTVESRDGAQTEVRRTDLLPVGR